MSKHENEYFPQRLSKLKRNFEGVHNKLRLILIILNGISFIIGFFYLIPLSHIQSNLNGQCTVYSNIHLIQIKNYTTIDPVRTIWSNPSKFPTHLII